MQQAHRTRMQVSAQSPEVVPSEAVLIPPVIHRRYFSGEDQQERRQGPQLVYPHPLLQLHPLLDLGRVLPCSPPVEIDHHHAGVEVARSPPGKRRGKRWV
ncbi:unnamed protein product [Cuscuta epithymum]|uniref:Uncharacterized protein n=1 Tax=Cuscuta epithymum TaxID=186058 RepID=A0AAV0CMR2_9ASTE|nr:unnamed protein product [Cuscuta epithymum]